MQYYEGIKIYDENTMYCFNDGTDYSIDEYEYSYSEDGEDNDITLLPEKCSSSPIKI